MQEPKVLLKFDDVSVSLKKSIESQLIEDLATANITVLSSAKNLKNIHQLIITQKGMDLVATLIKNNADPIRYPLSPGRCYSDGVLGIVRELYNLDKHEKGVRDILQEFQLRRIGLFDKI